MDALAPLLSNTTETGGRTYLGQQVMIISIGADTPVLVTLSQAETKPYGQMLAGE